MREFAKKAADQVSGRLKRIWAGPPGARVDTNTAYVTRSPPRQVRTTMNDIFPAPYLISVAEAARRLGMKPWPVYQLCVSGEIPQGRIGEQIVIPAEAVKAYADRVTGC